MTSPDLAQLQQLLAGAEADLLNASEALGVADVYYKNALTAYEAAQTHRNQIRHAAAKAIGMETS